MPRTPPPPDRTDVTKQLPGIKRYSRRETIEQWQVLMDAHDYGSALLFAQIHLLGEQADIAKKAWAVEVLKGQPAMSEYIKCECGADCKYHGYATKKQPCWGNVVAVETSDQHYCEGHYPLHFDREYLPEPPKEKPADG